MSTDAEMAAARAACIPDVPKILAAADRMAEVAARCAPLLNGYEDGCEELEALAAAMDAYRALRRPP